MNTLSIRTTLGMITLFEEDGALIALDWGEGMESADHSPVLDEAAKQIQEYLVGKRQDFDLPLDGHGTDYQRKVWTAMLDIPYGETRTYGQIAAQIGSGARSVGTACGRNPLPLIVPCHRVVGTASLGGYSAADGIETKRALLRLEGNLL